MHTTPEAASNQSRSPILIRAAFGVALPVLAIASSVAAAPSTASAASAAEPWREPPAAAPGSPDGGPQPGGASAAGAGSAKEQDDAAKGESAPKAPEDLLRGPKVPELDVKSDRPYVEGSKDGEKLSKPVLEQRVYFRAIDLMSFDAATKEKIDALRVAFVDRLAVFQKDAQKRRTELEAKRKLANPAEPPSEEFKREMNAIEAARPKLTELQAQVDALIGADRARDLQRKFTEELKRVRDEQTRRTEEERKRRRAEMEEQKRKQNPSGGEMPSGDGGGDEMSPSSPKSSNR
ncbi:MAG: hypothetical protein LW806_06365 [Planctomycetaceae bacterium]|nr:hypothetical protein [Planctomycetaceae bacterium]